MRAVPIPSRAIWHNVLNNELDNVFRGWYLRFRPQPQTVALVQKVA
jgi:hypothetical protein